MRYLITFLLVYSGLISVNAQAPVADFIANKTSGCATLSISFADKSTGNPRFWSWDFGNGQLANIQNPSANYSIPGKYTVKLVVRNENGADIAVKTEYIEVFPSPELAFTSDRRLVCKPAVVEFTDLSKYNSGTILSREWNFGDGSPVSTDINPIHTFDNIGYYNVSLKITTNTGCNAASTAFRYIRVVPGISTDFINLPTANCNAPFSVSFKNQSSGPGNVSYSWDFGNGLTSTVEDPTTSYPSATSYTVKLTAQSDYGCSGTKEKIINLSKTITDFTAPVNACPNSAITFTNTSSVVPVSSTWYFSDGVQVQQINAIRSFASEGTYTAKLVNKYADCIDSVTKSFTIIKVPVIDFSVDDSVSCKIPFAVNFKDNSPDANQWQWDFGDGNLDSGKNVQHTYTKEGVFNVTLNLQTSTGCQGSKTKAAMITVAKPVVKIGNVPSGGCAPYKYSAIANIITVDSVKTYSWNFGDGGTSSLKNPTYTYLKTGKFDLKLTIVTNRGCTESVTIHQTIKVGTPPVLDFTTLPVEPYTGCASDTVAFLNNTKPADLFMWNFGDGGDTSMSKNPRHKFIKSGKLSIQLIAVNNGCADSLTKSIVTIKPPAAKFDYDVSCLESGGLKINFINQTEVDPSPGVTTTYRWEWGDPGNNFSTSAGPVSFTYPVAGVYSVKLIVTSDNGCKPDTYSKTVNLMREKPSFTIKNNPICRNQPFTLVATNTNGPKVKTYEWKIGNLFTYSNDTINKLDTFVSISGIYEVQLAITDTNGCRDVLSIPDYLKVFGPKANFSVLRNGACVNKPVSFIDASVSIAPIRKWTFAFGDGDTKSFTSPPFSHVYPLTNIYNVRLIVEDTAACADTILKPFSAKITRPRANFGTKFTSFCASKNLQFIDSSSGGVNFSYLWDFGDGTTGSTTNPIHQYAVSGSPYTVKLKIVDDVGCSDSLQRKNYITIATPKAVFSIKDTVAICPPLETKFTFEGTGYSSFYWVLGDGTDTLDIKDPTYFYNDYGNFVAKLVVEGNGGCLDSAKRNVYVHNPQTAVKINYPPTKVCNEAIVEFDVTTPQNTKFVFYYGDQSADSSQTKNLKHLYNFPGWFNPYVELRDIYGCTANVGGATRIEILGSLPVYSASGKKFCDSATIFFNNFSLDNDPPTNYLWDFGDGSSSSVFEPFHKYSSPGLYSVSLKATTESNCAKTFTDTIRIFSTPKPLIISSDTICLNGPISFEGALAKPDTTIKWIWQLNDGRIDSSSNVVTFGFNGPGTYVLKLTAKNSFGCKDSTTKPLDINPIPKINMPASLAVVLAKSVTIPATYDENITTYNWSPADSLSCADCPTPTASPKLTTTYRVKVVDENGCSNASSITIKVLCDNSNFFIPNTFSPNNDGVNDKFYPRGKGIERIQNFRIFNRWGEIVYEKREFSVNDASVGWDGYQKGKPAAMDTYVYIIELVCENATIISYKGNVTLIR